MLRLLSIGLVAFSVAHADDPAKPAEKVKPVKERILGYWEMVKTEEPVPDDLKVILVFTKDKLTLHYTLGDNKMKDDRKWELSEDEKKLVTRRKDENNEEIKEIDSIEKFTEKELITVNDSKEKTTFKRIEKPDDLEDE